jgi:predicted ATPase
MAQGESGDVAVAPPWIGRPDLTLLSLSRLPPRQRAEMIAHVTGGKALPKEISDQIVERTDGVPLFVEELTKAVVESGILTETGDHYTVSGPVAPLAIPTSLHGSLLARLDRLAPTREVAQIGAALGRQFSHELISAVAATPQQSVDDALAQLVSAELIFRRGTPPDAEYTFKHALIRDAAYDTLLRSSRQQLHARIAAVLEKRFPETAAATPEVLAQHYTAAGIVSQAIPYWLKAGRAALQRSALIEAISHLTRGLELVQGIPDESNRAELELELQASLAPALTAARGYAAAEVEQTYARARTLCDQLSNSPQLFPVLYGLFIFHWCRGHLQTAQDGASEMLDIALRAGDPALQLIGHGALGEITWHIGDNKTALDHLNEAYSRYDENVHASHASVYGLDFGVMVLSYLDSAQLVLGYPDRSLQAGNQAVALARRLKHPVILCSALGFGVTNMLYRRDPSAIVKLADECIALAGELGFPHWIGMATAYRGWALAQLGAAEDGINQVRQGISTWRATGADVALGCYLAALSESQLVGHHAEAALSSADEAIAWVERNGEGQWKTLAHCCRGDALLALNASDQARSEYELALSAARQQGAKWWELRAAIHLARLRQCEGKREDARKILEPIYSWFGSGFELRDLKEAKALLDELR